MVGNFLLILIGILLMLAFAIGMIARGWLLKIDDLVLHGIDVPRARDVVAMYVENVHDTRFGFPTGVFRIDEGRSTPSRLVAREINFGAGAGFRIVRYGVSIPLAFIAAAADAGCFAGMVAFFVGCMVVAFVIGPIFCIAVIEFVLRWLMRSEIVTELEPVPGDHDACRVRFTLRGLSAFGVRRQLRDGLARPVLPVAFGGSALENTPEPWTADRLNVVYASGIAIALVLAALIVALTPSLRGDHSANASYGYDTGANVSGYSDSNGSGSYDGTASSDTTSTDSASGADTSSTDTSTDGSSADGSSADASSTDTTATDATTTDGQDASASTDAQPPATDGRLAADAVGGTTFAIHPPRGWIRTSDNVQRDGFVHSGWRSPDDPQAVFIVDYTPDYLHTVRYSAQSVRRLYWHGRVSDYQELDFSSSALDGRPAWRWEFETNGLHKVDTFVVGCGTGYAVLGAAPVDSWDQYSDTFAAATDTFTASCDSSSGAGG